MFVYLTTNLINGKKYIGKQKDTNPLYLGSGKILRIAIKKYSKINFKKEIIEECINESHLNEREKYWIAYYNAVESADFYNIAEGGMGGNTGNRSYKGLKKKDIYGINWINPNKGNSVLTKYKNDIINMYTIDKMSLREIAKHYNCFSGTVKRFLQNNNIKINRFLGNERANKIIIAKKPTTVYKQQIIDNFNAGITIPNISKKYKIGYNTVANLLKKEKIKRFSNRYPETKRPISLKDKQGNIYRYNSLTECANSINTTISSLCALLCGRTKTCKSKRYTLFTEVYNCTSTN